MSCCEAKCCVWSKTISTANSDIIDSILDFMLTADLQIVTYSKTKVSNICLSANSADHPGVHSTVIWRAEVQSSSQGGFGLDAEQIEFLLPMSSATCSVFLNPPPLAWLPSLRPSYD